MQLHPLTDVLLYLFTAHAWHGNHLCAGLRVVGLECCLPAAPVPDERTDVDGRHGLALDLLHHPRIDVLLQDPLDLVLTQRPCAGEFVVGDLDAAVHVLLQIHGTGQGDAIDLDKETLF